MPRSRFRYSRDLLLYGHIKTEKYEMNIGYLYTQALLTGLLPPPDAHASSTPLILSTYWHLRRYSQSPTRLAGRFCTSSP